MAKHKEKQIKDHLTHANTRNKKAPVWVYLKTKNRDLIRSRKRNWRFDKMDLKSMHKKKKLKLEKHRNPKYVK